MFAGGCTLTAAEAVCDAELERLASLLDNGLLRRQQPRDGEPRFRMHAAVREYASERLGPHDRDAVGERHARYYAALAERVGPELIGPATTMAIATLTQEYDNIRAALAYALTRDRELGFGLVAALRPFWGDATRGREISAWIEAASTGPAEPPTAARVGTLVVLGRQRMNAGRYAESRAALEQAVAAATEYGR
jgi:non-specific serine/threonine protein kinase